MNSPSIHTPIAWKECWAHAHCKRCGGKIASINGEFTVAENLIQYHVARHQCSLTTERLDQLAVIMKRYRKEQPKASLEDQQKVYDYLLKNAWN